MLLLSKFIADETDATAVEYGLIAAGIAVAIVTLVGTVGTNLSAAANAVK
jgi:pilus assembly protein Flp/PilA